MKHVLTLTTIVSLLLTPIAPAAQQQPAFVGKIWRSIDASAAPGTVRVFLPDGTLVMTSCVETYHLARWTRMNERRISWREDAARIDADVTRATANELQLRVHLEDEIKEENYRIAQAPYVCPDLRGRADASDLRVDGTIIYLERLALPPSAVVRVELRDMSRADAPARVLATQNIGVGQGPPFRYALSVPRAKVDARASLAVFAEIRDGSRLMFTTTRQYSVPREGATGFEVQLTFVSSARRDPAPRIVTPAPAAYRCGNETYKIAFEEGRAYVTTPDGSVVTLPRVRSRDAKPPRRYSDGRLTFVQGFEDGAEPRVLFARGRRALMPCTRQE